jgi:hypothetical protein
MPRGVLSEPLALCIGQGLPAEAAVFR